MKHKVVNVTEFRARCSELLSEVDERGHTITITKWGRPLATVGPAKQPAWKSLEGAWMGKLIIDDEVLLADTSHLWRVLEQGPGSEFDP